MSRVVATLTLLACANVAAAAAPPENHRNFVACPVVRDTSSVPCWLAEYEGETYFLTIQTDVSAPVNPPWLGHKVLVEGTVSDEPRICGGIVLKPVALSVMKELDGSCNTILPAEERYNLTFEPPRPPGPSLGRLAFGDPVMKPKAEEAAGPRSFEMRYEFDSMVMFRHAQPLQKILEHAKQTGATDVKITGYRGATLLSNGQVMQEDKEIGRRRAEQIADLLRGAGLVDVKYDVQWKDEAKRAKGVDDAAIRRVQIVVSSAHASSGSDSAKK
jgi:outer membrane protein OmpA-like peptidoglycan-associated protein